MKINLGKWLLLFAMVCLVFSCAPTKKGAYLRNSEPEPNLNNPDKVFFIESDSANVIQPGDQLYITVSSGNDDPNVFNQTTGTALTTMDILTYSVDGTGTIRFPYLKTIKAAGLTRDELADNLEKDLSQYIYLPSAKVRIVNNIVTILGEVNGPGQYLFDRGSLNIFQALGFAGDLAPFGNRKRVMIIRQEGDIVKKKHVDLLNDEIIGSEWYNIQTNDIIYVEPLARKKWGMETFSVFSWLSLITTIILTYTVLVEFQSNPN